MWKIHIFVFLNKFLKDYYACVLTIFECAEVYWQKKMHWVFVGG